MSAESFTACEHLLSATVNGVYQGLLVTVLAGLTLRFFPRTNAATRHAVWYGVLLLVTALIPAHLLLSFRSRPEIRTVTTPPASSMMTTALASAYDGMAADPPLADVPIADPQPVERDAGGEAGSDSGRFTWSFLKPLTWNLETAISLPHSICLCLVSLWLLLAGIRGGLMARRLVEVRRVKTAAQAPAQVLQALFDRLRPALGVRRNVLLKICGTHRTAVVLGFVHPVVLLPTEMERDANEAEVEQVLRHELAHVVRRDDWGNLGQQLIQAALFFHPAIWWISSRISLEREIACDDYVLAASGSPRAYALTLANVASRMSHGRHLLAPGVSNNNSQLQQRITMILNTNRNISPRLAKSRLGFFTTATAILAVLAIDAGPRLVLAESPPEAVTTTITGPIAASPFEVASAPDGPGVESGPRSKPSGGEDEAPAVPASAPVAAAAPAAPVAGARPEPPAPPTARARKKNMSIEERLDRLERALEQLQAHDGGKGRHWTSDGPSYPMAAGAMGSGMSHALPGDSKMDMELKRAADEMRRAMEEAQREMEAGHRAAEASQRNAEQAMRDMAKLKSKDYERLHQKYSDMASEAPLRELEALRSARESLEKELQNISRQIKRLEQDQNRPKSPAEEQPGGVDKGSKLENQAAAKTL